MVFCTEKEIIDGKLEDNICRNIYWKNYKGVKIKEYSTFSNKNLWLIRCIRECRCVCRFL